MGRLLDEDMVINALQTTKFRNDLFVDRGYARAISIIRELPAIQPEKAQLSQEGTTFDLISRAAAQTEVMMKCERYTLARESHGMGHVEWSSDLISVGDAMDAIRDLPSVQPEPAIPLSWIENEIKWLKSLDNTFSEITALQISVMVKKWKDEQNETD